MITRNGDSRQAERTREYVSIGENRMSVRANFNKKHYDIKITLCFCRVFFYVVHPTSNVLSKCYHNRQLPNGTLAAHTNTYLSLLPPGPDEVRKIYVAQEPFVQHLLLWASLTGDALWSGIHSIYSGFMVTGCRYLPNQHVAERRGFEPLIRLITYTRFPGERLQPTQPSLHADCFTKFFNLT